MAALLLDHISVVPPRGGFGRHGLRVSATPGGAGHARVFLDRCYIEVRRGGSRADWFLRPLDLPDAVAALRAAGLAASDPVRYKGHDGHWHDVQLGRATAGLPMLTQRLDQPAERWPPPLTVSHPSHARTISELSVRTDRSDDLARALQALGARPAGDDRFELDREVVVRVAAGRPESAGLHAYSVCTEDGARIDLLPDG